MPAKATRIISTAIVGNDSAYRLSENRRRQIYTERNIMKLHLLCALLVVLVTAGCASSPWGQAQSGGAVYHYTKTSDGCEISITSARELLGVSVDVSDDCHVTVKAENVDGANALGVIEGLTKRIPLP